MTKNDYINAITEKAQMKKKDVIVVLEAINAVVADCLGTDEIPVIDGLKLTTVAREARVGRNPSTGEAISIPAKIVPKAKIGKALKELIA